jgi:integrase
MASLTITTRQTTSGPRYVVRFRLGGRAYPIVHGGSFRTLKEAKTRRDLIAGELAAGRNPADALRAMVDRPVVRTFAEWAEAYRTSRVDYAAETTKNLASHLKAILPTFQTRDPATITPADVQEWLAGLTLKPSSVRRYVATLRGIFDFIGLDPNPARDSRVRLPREEHVPVDPPSAADVDTIIENVPPRWRLPLRVLEQTGMRVGELAALEWGDVDEQSLRFRVKQGKTTAARRWVAVPDWLMAEVAGTCPREDRTAERPVFQGFTADVAKNVMARACKHAGIVHRHPHDLRHRYASVQIGRGVAVTQVAAQLGHAKEVADVGHVFARFGWRLGRPGVVPVWSQRPHRDRKPAP